MKNAIQLFSRIQIISSIVWALVMVSSYFILETNNQQFNIILLSGFFVEFLLINTSKKQVKEQDNSSI